MATKRITDVDIVTATTSKSNNVFINIENDIKQIAIQQLVFDAVYPVGSIYMSVNSTNPTALFGGTWERLENRFLLGAGSSYSLGATAGAATVALTTANMPAHKHTFSGSGTTGNYNTSHRHNMAWDKDGGSGSNRYTVHNSGVNGSQGGTAPTSYAGGNHSHSFSYSGTTASTGSTTAHNNMPPYLVVNMWKRTA